MSGWKIVQVEVLEAVALGDGAREALGGEVARLQQDVLGRLARAARLLDRLRHAVAVGEPEVDDDVGEKARGAPGPARLRDAGRARLGRHGLEG